MAYPLGSVAKRTLKDIDEWLSPGQIYTLITLKAWPYKENASFNVDRDRCMMALYFLTGGRNNEVLRLTRGQIQIRKDFVMVSRMHISKRTKKTIAKMGPKVTLRNNILLPRFGELVSFTNLVIKYLEQIQDPDRKLFPFGVRRSHQLVKHITGKWVHWFRSMSENYYGQIFGDAVKLAKFMGVTNVQSVMAYIPFDEQYYRRALKEKT